MLFKSFELYLAFRYLRSKKTEGFISLSTWFSFVGIALGVATLIIVMSVMNGFREELVNRILGINGHLVVYANNGKLIENYNDISKKVSDNNNVFSVIPQIDGQGLARSKEYVSGVMIKDQDVKTKKLNYEMIENLNIIKKLGYQSRDALIKSDIEKFGKIMHDHWNIKKKRSKQISNKKINDWYDIAVKNGAIGGKLIGAGGGGFLLFLADNKKKLRTTMNKLGLLEVNFQFEFEGAKII